MLEIVGHRVLIRPKPLETTSAGGIVIAYGDKEKMHKAGTDEGTVVQVGEMAWKNPELGYGSPDWKPWAEVGDQVLYAKYSGKWVIDPSTEEEFIVVNDVDIQVRVKE